MSVCAYVNVAAREKVHVFIFCMCVWTHFLLKYLFFILVTIGFVIVFCLFATFFHLFVFLLVVIIGSFASFSGVRSNVHFEMYLYCSSWSRTSSRDSSWQDKTKRHFGSMLLPPCWSYKTTKHVGFSCLMAILVPLWYASLVICIQLTVVMWSLWFFSPLAPN